MLAVHEVFVFLEPDHPFDSHLLFFALIKHTNAHEKDSMATHFQPTTNAAHICALHQDISLAKHTLQPRRSSHNAPHGADILEEELRQKRGGTGEAHIDASIGVIKDNFHIGTHYGSTCSFLQSASWSSNACARQVPDFGRNFSPARKANAHFPALH